MKKEIHKQREREDVKEINVREDETEKLLKEMKENIER